MATLKSIKNKYLSASDGTVLGVTTNTENISLLSFKLATADSLTKFNLVDGFADDYNDATGVDDTASTNEVRDSTDNFYVGETSVEYTIHKFTSTGTFTTDTAQDVEYLVLGGGGGGGGSPSTSYYGGGGGAGGFRTGTGFPVPAASYSVTVGTGGSGGGPGAAAGGASSFSSITSAGGGWGGVTNGPGAGAGGSGGGGTNSAGAGNTPSVSPSQGYPGSNGMNQGTGRGMGAGGGAGEIGGPTGNGAGGIGGDGVQYDIIVRGTMVWYAGGGGGYGHSDGGGAGGAGGAGGGGKSNTPSRGDSPVAGTDGLGGGGGGGGFYAGSPGKDGGDGLVVIRRPTGSGITATGGTITTDTIAAAGGDLTLQSNAFTAQTQADTVRIVIDQGDYLGTSTLNTDIKAYASRDGFATAGTQIQLANQGVIESVAANQGGIDSNTKLMLHMDGAYDGTTFTDSSSGAKTITRVGDPVTRTNVKKFGTASGWFDGNGDCLTLADSEDWNFGTGDFTFDWWVNLASMGNFIHIGQREAAFGWEILTSASNLHFWTPAGNFGADPSGSVGDISGTWTHLAVVRNGSNLSMYKNGTSISSTDGTAGNGGASMASVASLVSIGARTNGTYYPFDGYIDELRITKGVARWTSNFTPPTAPYTDGDPRAAFDRRLLSGSADISGQPAGTSMKYKIETLNQSVSKIARVYGTSMAWA